MKAKVGGRGSSKKSLKQTRSCGDQGRELEGSEGRFKIEDGSIQIFQCVFAECEEE